MKRKLFLLLCTLLGLLSSVQGVKAAYTDYLNAANGYEEVTSAGELANADYYYVFASAENSDIIVGIADKSDMLPDWYSGTAKILCYKNLSSNPISDATYFFILENNSGYEMYNVGYNPSTKFQTHTDKAYLWVNTGYSNSDDYTKFIPAFDDTNKYWTLQNNKYPTAESKDANGWYGFLGPWTAKYVADGEHLAANRTNVNGDDAGHFKIYRIKRTRYAKDAQIYNPDVTNTYISNPSFELKSAGTAQTGVVTSSGATALALYGWTENLNGINSLRNSDWVNSTTKGTSSKYSNAIASADGTWHYYARKGWSDQNTADITLTSNDMTLPRGYYVLSCKYLLEENSRSGNPSNGSFLTLKAMSATAPVAAQESPKAYTSNVENATYTHTEWQTLSVAFNVTSESTIKAVLALTPRGGVNTEVHVDDFSLTYSPFADADDYAELTTAISTAEAYTLGFDAGEYAPYNVLPILNAAKAIKSDENNGYSTVRELINALNGITANATEVNAFYDGNFAIQSEQTTGPTALAGWNNPEGIRQLIKNTETYPGLNSASAKAAVFAWGSTTLIYGEQAGYTIPLKGHTIYELSLKICGWKDGNMGYVNVDVKNSKNEGLATYTTASVTKRITESEPWAEYNLLFTTGDAGIYKFGMWTSKHTTFTDLVLKKATAEKIKPLLLTEITNANNIYNDGVNVGSGVFQIPVAAGTAFEGAIAEAQAVYNNASATADELTAAIDALKDAEDTYANAELNAPDAKTRYVLSLDGRGALTFQPATTEGNYGLPFAEASSNRAQNYMFEATGTTNVYKLYFYDIDGNKRYICTRAQYGTGGTGTAGIRTFVDGTEGMEALLIKIQATNTANVFNMLNTERNDEKLGSSGGDFYTDGTYSSWSISEASTATANLKVSNGKLGTFIAPFDVVLPTGVKAYSATSDTEKVTLTKEYEGGEKLPAGTPVIIYGDGVNVNDNFEGYSCIAGNKTVGALTGMLVDKTVPANAYVLQTQESTQAFYQLETSATASFNRCYVTANSVGAEARLAIVFEDDDPTAISAIEAAESEAGALKDGKYLIDGKIVIVKNGVKYDANGKKLN